MSVTTLINSGGIVTAESSSGITAIIPLVAGGSMNFGGFGGFLSVSQTATIQ